MTDTKDTDTKLPAAYDGKTADPSLLDDVRVCTIGAPDSGKSTLVGVLVGGVMDNGRGLARSRVFAHAHEGVTGRTSSITQHLLGFDAQRKPVHDSINTNTNASSSASTGGQKKGWKAIVEQSETLLTLIDLAGHEKYLKTTITGLCGCHPHYALVIVNALSGVAKMTREHLGIVLALGIPFGCVVTKVDLAPPNVFERTQSQLTRILKSQHAKKLPLVVRDEKDVTTCLSNAESGRICPIFCVSAVTGKNLDLLTSFLSQLKPSTFKPPTSTSDNAQLKPVEFHLEETWLVPGVGLCVSGTVVAGTIEQDMTLKMGPEADGGFREVVVKSIQYKRVNVPRCTAGLPCALSIRAGKRRGKESLKRTAIHRGMVLLDPKTEPQTSLEFFAEVLILHHPTTIRVGYQTVIHCGALRQSATIVELHKPGEQDKPCLRTGDKARVKFRFVARPEYIRVGSVFLFREGTTKGIGTVVDTLTPSTPSSNTPGDPLANDTKVSGGEKLLDKPDSKADSKAASASGRSTSSAIASSRQNVTQNAPVEADGGDDGETVAGVEANGVNLDITGFLCLVSQLTNVTHTLESIARDFPVGTQANERALEEMKAPALDGVLKFIGTKNLYMCRTAESQCRQLLELLATEEEKKRAEQWFSKIRVIPDRISDRSKVLLTASANKCKPQNVRIFGTGDHYGLVTVTSNLAFVRCAKEHGGFEFRVHTHAARPLACTTGPRKRNPPKSTPSNQHTPQ